MKAVPTVRALFLCERVIVEERTRNVTLVNCFGRFVAPEYPTPLEPFFVYAGLINGKGTMGLRVTVDPLDSMQPVYAHEQEVTFPDRILEVDFRFRVVTCTLPRSGRYSVNLYADHDLIAQTEVEAARKEA